MQYYVTKKEDNNRRIEEQQQKHHAENKFLTPEKYKSCLINNFIKCKYINHSS